MYNRSHASSIAKYANQPNLCIPYLKRFRQSIKTVLEGLNYYKINQKDLKQTTDYHNTDQKDLEQTTDYHNTDQKDLVQVINILSAQTKEIVAIVVEAIKNPAVANHIKAILNKYTFYLQRCADDVKRVLDKKNIENSDTFANKYNQNPHAKQDYWCYMQELYEKCQEIEDKLSQKIDRITSTKYGINNI